MALCCWSGVARADGADTDPETEIARGHFRRGTAAYDAGQFDKAIVEFEAARAVKPLSAFDYNIGRCYERLGKLREAVIAYRRWLRANESDPTAAEVDAHVQDLERAIAQAQMQTRDSGTGAGSGAGSGSGSEVVERHRRATWVAVCGAAALLVAGAATLVVARLRFDD